MENPKEINSTTILDLDIYTLYKIFDLLGKTDSFSLAQVHPYLNEAFASSFRTKKLCMEFFSKEDLTFLIKNCGEHIKNIVFMYISTVDDLNNIEANLPNLKIVTITECMSCPTEMDVNRLARLAKWPIQILFLNRLRIDNIIQMIRNCGTLRTLLVTESPDIDINSIQTILDVLDDRGTAPDKPFELVLHKESTSVDDNLLTELSKCDKSHLLKIDRIVFYTDDSDSDSVDDDDYDNFSDYSYTLSDNSDQEYVPYNEMEVEQQNNL